MHNVIQLYLISNCSWSGSNLDESNGKWMRISRSCLKKVKKSFLCICFIFEEVCKQIMHECPLKESDMCKENLVKRIFELEGLMECKKEGDLLP